MKSATEKICDFLNVRSEDLRECPVKLVDELIKKANSDDWFEVHQLGYNIKMEGNNFVR